MNILAIDTSNLVMGVAITSNGRVLGEYITNMKKNHSVRLMPAIERLMKDVDMEPSELDRIAVAMGPGSYTGVRIGVTVAKTLAWTLNKDLVGISSLEVLAQNGGFFNGLMVPYFDARRGQVYTGLYQSLGNTVHSLEEDRLLLMDDWLEYLKTFKEPILFLSQDTDKHGDSIQKELSDQAAIGSSEISLARPAQLAKLAADKEPVDNIHSFVPQYLQLAEAEANWLKRQKGVEKQ